MMHIPNVKNSAAAEVNITDSKRVLSSDSNHEFATKLARAFIEFCAQDGEESGTSLTQQLSVVNQSLVQARYELDKISRVGESAKTNLSIGKFIAQAMTQLSEALVAIQAFDRIVQRLIHAARIINELEKQPEKPDFRDDPADERRERLRYYNMLSMEDERAIFRALEDGAMVRDAVLAGVNALKNRFANMDDNIEFF